MSSIYLAGPFFNQEQIEKEDLVNKALEQNKSVTEIFRPCKIKAENEFGTKEWKKEIFNLDVEHIDSCDVVVAIVDFIKNGNEIVSDPGTCWEIGYAFGIKKPVFLVSFDEDLDNSVLNVMLDLGSRGHFVKNSSADIFKQLKEFDFSVIESSLFIPKKHDWKTT